MYVLTKLFCEQTSLGESKRKTFGWMKNLGCKRENLGFPYFYGLKYPPRPAEIEICERGKHQSCESADENEVLNGFA